MPTKKDIGDQIQKAYPGARVLTYHLSKLVSGEPFLQIEDMSGMSQRSGDKRSTRVVQV